MTKQINQLTEIDTLATGDLLAVWDTSGGSNCKASIEELANLIAPTTTDRVYEEVEDADVITLDQTTNNIWLLLENLESGAAGITLVTPQSPRDGQEILISKMYDASAGNITFTLSAFNATGNTLSTLTNARLSTRIKYDLTSDKWWAAGY